MTDIILSVFLPVLFISFVVYIYIEAKNNKKRTEKYIEECNTRIEWFRENMRIASELQNISSTVDFLVYEGDEKE